MASSAEGVEPDGAVGALGHRDRRRVRRRRDVGWDDGLGRRRGRRPVDHWLGWTVGGCGPVGDQGSGVVDGGRLAGGNIGGFRRKGRGRGRRRRRRGGPVWSRLLVRWRVVWLGYAFVADVGDEAGVARHLEERGSCR